MKKYLVIFVMIITVIIIACSEDTPSISDVTNKTELSVEDEDSELNRLFENFKTLNSQYKSRYISRGRNYTGLYIQLADIAGAFAGGYYGGQAGGAIVTFLGGGPVSGILGAMIGGGVGSHYGKEFASGLARKSIGCGGIVVPAPPRLNGLYWNADIKVSYFTQVYLDEIDEDIVLDHNILIDKPIIGLENPLFASGAVTTNGGSIGNIGDDGGIVNNMEMILNTDVLVEKADSLGYYHNLLMAELEINEHEYIIDGKPDVDKINTVILDGIKDRKLDSCGILEDEDFISRMKELASTLGTMAFTAYGSSIDEYINMQCLYMSENCNMPEEEILIYKNFIAEIAKTCAGMTVSETNQYAMQLNDLIKTSEVSSKKKIDLALGAQAAINTALCWR